MISYGPVASPDNTGAAGTVGTIGSSPASNVVAQASSDFSDWLSLLIATTLKQYCVSASSPVTVYDVAFTANLIVESPL